MICSAKADLASALLPHRCSVWSKPTSSSEAKVRRLRIARVTSTGSRHLANAKARDGLETVSR